MPGQAGAPIRRCGSSAFGGTFTLEGAVDDAHSREVVGPSKVDEGFAVKAYARL